MLQHEEIQEGFKNLLGLVTLTPFLYSKKITHQDDKFILCG